MAMAKKKNRTWINKKNSTPHECNIIFSGGGRLHVMSRRAHWPTKIIMTSTQSKICFHCSALCPFCVSWELFWRCFDASWEKAVVVTLLFFFFLFLIIQHKMQSKQSPKHSTAYFLHPPPPIWCNFYSSAAALERLICGVLKPLVWRWYWSEHMLTRKWIQKQQGDDDPVSQSRGKTMLFPREWVY